MLEMTEARLQEIVRENLRGDEVILRWSLFERTQRPDYLEDAYIVVWQSDYRDEGRDCGTHKVCVNSSGETAMFWGHYDLNREKALADHDERMKGAPARFNKRTPEISKTVRDGVAILNEDGPGPTIVMPAGSDAESDTYDGEADHAESIGPDSYRGPDGVLGNDFNDKGW